MSKRTIIPFGPQHPVLPEPVHLDLVLEDELVVDAIPRIGFVHRGLEKLVEKRDYTQFVYITERICGICSFGHSYGYSECIEQLMQIEVPPRAQYLRVIFHELSRIHSHLLWLGLMADAFGYEALFMHCWRLRETVLDIFERITGGRVIFSACNVGGFKREVSNNQLAGIVTELEKLQQEYKTISKAFLEDSSVKNRMVGIGYISKKDATMHSMVGPFARASGLAIDERLDKVGAYGELSSFVPVTSEDGDCYARCAVRIEEVNQSIAIIKELSGKIPDGEIMNKPKGKIDKGALAMTTLEQPRGQAFYYAKGNGTKFLERMRVRTPTSQNLSGLVAALQGCEFADVPVIILTIDPCISCTER
ncbi:MAG: nickel-dependent hydrogenase large subunit [Coriobacteriales bacterium]|nr:nickel-dependent hydrogenase large subunit [Coriobacteriales bacterium]